MTVADRPTVAFHTGVSDAVDHALRLVRKALSQDSRVLLAGPSAMLDRIDERLWTDDPGSFIPHVRWHPGAQGAALDRAPVWLLEVPSNDTGEGLSQPSAASGRVMPIPARDVLINLGADLDTASPGFRKVIEIVTPDPQARRQGQQRWRAYRERGLEPAHHAFS